VGRFGSCALAKATGFKTTAIVAPAVMLTNVRLRIGLSLAEESARITLSRPFLSPEPQS
jgi:hypothetical protein